MLAETTDMVFTPAAAVLIDYVRSNRDALSACARVSPTRFSDWVWWNVSSEAPRSECG